jgi:tetratricopeptide (TPR) repeat protein
LKFLISLFIYLLTAITAYGQQDVAALVKEGNRLEAVPDEKAAFHKFKEVLKLNATNIYALNKCSELCSRIGQRETVNTKLRSEYYQAAKIYAQTALKVDPKNSEANCVMAIALGRSSMSKSGRDKIDNAREVKKYVDAAIANDATNFKAWHVLGRWQYEISNLNGLERGLVKVLYGALPPATIKQSIASFEKARALRPEFLLNYYEMAKAYKDNDNKNKAIAYLQLLLTLPNQTEDDPAIKIKAKALIKEWQ